MDKNIGIRPGKVEKGGVNPRPSMLCPPKAKGQGDIKMRSGVRYLAKRIAQALAGAYAAITHGNYNKHILWRRGEGMAMKAVNKILAEHLSVPQKIYESEINFQISCIWGAGFGIAIGDEVRGCRAEGYVQTWEEVLVVLDRLAREVYPDSNYAKS